MGFIKIDRDIVDWQYFNKEPMLRLWIYLLCSASYKDNYYDGILIKKGQLVTGRKKLAKILNISEQITRTCLDRLKSTNQITIEATTKYSVITIVKWSEYQDKPNYINQEENQDVNQQLTNEQPTSNQQLTTTKESKAIKEVKESLYIHNNEPLSPFTELEKELDEIEKEKETFLNQSLFDLFETEFGRTISSMELQRLSEWMSAYEDKLIRYALREALTYNKKNFDYIDRILQTWKEKNFTAEEYEKGKR